MDDEDEYKRIVVFASEHKRLQKVFETSSDLCLARHNEEFAGYCSGIERLQLAHEAATKDLEQWYSEREGDA